MKIELKKISYSKALSEETSAYAAQLWINGKHAADVSNHGQGGPDMVYDKDRTAVAAAEAYIATLPAVEAYGMTLPQTLETVCGDLLNDHLLLKDMKRRLKGSLLFVEDGKLYSSKYKGVKTLTEAHVVRFKDKHPAVTLLNVIPETEAFNLFKTLAA